MTHEQLVEEVVEKLDIICKQADQYQINAGYPVETPARDILRSIITTTAQRVREETIEEIIPLIDAYYDEAPVDALVKKLKNLSTLNK